MTTPNAAAVAWQMLRDAYGNRWPKGDTPMVWESALQDRATADVERAVMALLQAGLDYPPDLPALLAQLDGIPSLDQLREAFQRYPGLDGTGRFETDRETHEAREKRVRAFSAALAAREPSAMRRLISAENRPVGLPRAPAASEDFQPCQMPAHVREYLTESVGAQFVDRLEANTGKLPPAPCDATEESRRAARARFRATVQQTEADADARRSGETIDV